MATVIGIDKTKNGWVAVAAEQDTIRACRFVETVDDVITLWPDAAAYGIDIPLFLVESGTRAAEDNLRQLLGPAARSIFTSPTRAALDAATQAEATALNRSHGGPGISAQSFGLFAAIRQARDAVGSLPDELRGRWFETHPETAFVLLAQASAVLGDASAVLADASVVVGGASAKAPLAPKRSATGVLERIGLLATVFAGFVEVDTATLPHQVKIDDVLDAAAAAWSAQRVLTGDALVFGTGAIDSGGHRDRVVI